MVNSTKPTKSKNESLIKLENFLSSYFDLLIGLLVFIILISGFLIIILPKYRQVDTKVKLANEQLDKEYIKLSGYLKKLQTINNDYSNINQDSINKIKKFLPAKPETESLIEKMEFIAKNNGLLLSSLDIDSDQDKPDEKTGEIKQPILNPDLPAGVGTIKISMNLNAINYRALKNLLSVLEKSLRLMDVVNLEFSPNDESAVLVINTYYFR